MKSFIFYFSIIQNLRICFSYFEALQISDDFQISILRNNYKLNYIKFDIKEVVAYLFAYQYILAAIKLTNHQFIDYIILYITLRLL